MAVSVPAGRTALGAATAGGTGDGGEGENQADDDFTHGQTLPWEFAPDWGTHVIGGDNPALPRNRHRYADPVRRTTGRTSQGGWAWARTG